MAADTPLASASRAGLAFALGVVLACGPWFVKNGLVTGNPTYPLFYSVFGGRNWNAEKNAKWEWGHRVPLFVALGLQVPPAGGTARRDDPQHGITMRLLATNVKDVTAQADWLSPLLFGFAPLAFFRAPARRAAAWLAVFVVYLFFQWWLLTHRLDRFWVPLIPIVALLAGAGAAWSELALWRWFVACLTTACVFFNFSYAVTPLCGYNAYTSRLDAAKRDPTDEAVNVMNVRLPRSARVLAVGAADLFHLNRSVVYNTVFDDSIFEQVARNREPQQVRAELQRRGITHVYVNWAEVRRYRESYGFTEFVKPRVFRALEAAGVLRPVYARTDGWVEIEPLPADGPPRLHGGFPAELFEVAGE